MKQMIKYTLTIVALLFVSIGAVAAGGDYTVTYKLDNIDSSESLAGTVVLSFNGQTATLTVTPVEGNYLTIDDLTVIKIIDGSNAQARSNAPGYNTPIELAAVDATADPSKQTQYTFAKPGNEYEYEITANFHSRTSIEDATITIENDCYPYSGDEIKPGITMVKLTDGTELATTDYSVEYANNINVPATANSPQPTITITGIGIYKGTKSTTFTITPKSIAGVTIEDIPEQTYTGNAIEPAVTVKDGKSTLELNKDYTVSYSDNTSVADATAEKAPTVTITGMGNYDPNTTASKNFTITAMAGTPTVTLKNPDEVIVYDGTPKEPEVIVSIVPAEGATPIVLTADDYDIEYSDNVNAGKETAKATVTLKGNYTGTATATFTITPKSIAGVTIEDIPEQTYTGSAIEPAVTVKDGESTLELNKDYTVSYSNNIAAADATAEKAPTVTITGMGNYDPSTTASKKFTITAMAGIPTVTLKDPDEVIVYDGTAKEPEVIVSIVPAEGASPIVLTTDDYDIEFSDNVNAGTNTAKATVTLKGSYTGTATATFTITPKSIAGVTIEDIADQTYTGDAIEPAVTVKDGESTLELNKDYTVSYSDNIAAADATAEKAPTVTITGMGNYDPSTTASKKFTITAMAAAPTVTLKDPDEVIVYDGTAKEPEVIVSIVPAEGASPIVLTTDDYDIEYSDNVNAGTNTAKATVTLKGSYTGTATVTFTIEKAKGTISYATASVEKTIGDDAFTNELINTGDGDVEYASNNEDVATVDAATGEVTIVGIGEATVTATVTDGTNYTYETKTASYQLMVDRAQEDGYGLWIGDIQVTDDNKTDVLENSAFFFDPTENLLVIKNNQEELSIESRLPNLTIFLNDACKLERIYFNNLGDAQNHGSLEITTYSNIPGKVSLATTHANGVISGFDDITIDNNSHTFLLDPIDGIYENGRLLTESGGEVAASATIGQYIKPLVKNQIVTFNPEDFITTDEDGNPIEVDLSNYIVDDILYTLKPETDGEGYDPEDKSICLLSPFNDDWVDEVAKAVENEEYIPGGETFAEKFTGITFMVPDGEGTIKLNLLTDAGYEFHLKIGTAEPITIVNTDPAKIIEIPYKVTKVTYVYLYMVEATSVAGARPVGKREKAHGRIYTVQVTPKKVEANNPLDEVDGFPAEDIQEVVIADDDTLTGVFKMKDNRPADNDIWYNMEGQKINKPTKKGIYIKNAKKIVI